MERRNELIRVPFLISFSCFRAKILIEREREGGEEGEALLFRLPSFVHRVYSLSRVLSREIYLGQVNCI